jgi:DNA-binding transcriptional MocR family regulator
MTESFVVPVQYEMSRTHPPLVPDTFDPVYRDALAAVMGRYSPSETVGAHRWMGTETDRMAGAEFTGQRLGQQPELGRVVLTNGTQSALVMLFGALAQTGKALAVESLAYPPALSIAQRYGIPVVPIDIDDHGLVPEALEAACRRDQIASVLLLSTLHNPTTVTMPVARREAIAAVARQHDLQIIEDDIYSLLPEIRLKPVSAFAPERSWYLLGVAKAIAPGLKIAFVVAPDGAQAEARFWPGVRATHWMSAPINAAVMAELIHSGGANRIIESVRAEMRERHRLVAPLARDMEAVTADGALHLWVPLLAPLKARDLAAEIRATGINVATADPYAVLGTQAPSALRIGIGHARTRQDLLDALEQIAEIRERAISRVPAE